MQSKSGKSSVGVIVGSLRKNSWSRKLAEEVMRRAEPQLSCRIIEIGDLSLYNEDLDASPPKPWERFRSEIRDSNAVLFVTPEYNRSIPGPLKNALDIGSRPAGRSQWAGKPAAVISQTPYLLGAFGANHALRQTFVFLDMPVLQQPEIYIGSIGGKFSKEGQLADDETGKKLDGFVEAFSRWIALVGAAKSVDFGAFMQNRDDAASAYVNGDTAPLEAMLPDSGPASFMSPTGEVITGDAAVRNRYRGDAKSFLSGGRSKLEVLHSESGQLAFWSGIQHATVLMKNQVGAIPMDLQVTEVFRSEGGQWKLIHRHANMPARRSEEHDSRSEGAVDHA